MENYCVADLEANGLLTEATKVHCICWVDSDGTEHQSTDIEGALKWLDTYKYVVFHNGCGYDLPLLKRLYGWQPQGFHDTAIMSRLIDPDRKGGHSIEAWGEYFGEEKQGKDITDWSVLTDEMLTRCMVDARIGWKVFEKLKKEML